MSTRLVTPSKIHFSSLGCPGLNIDCSGHGTCFSAQRVCECNRGWTGSGCHIPRCPGSPQCSSHGKCVVTSDIPTCTCDDGWMGGFMSNYVPQRNSDQNRRQPGILPV